MIGRITFFTFANQALHNEILVIRVIKNKLASDVWDVMYSILFLVYVLKISWSNVNPQKLIFNDISTKILIKNINVSVSLTALVRPNFIFGYAIAHHSSESLILSGVQKFTEFIQNMSRN